jgi:hypothetical protein
MRDGWYRVIDAAGEQKIGYCYRNLIGNESVPRLLQRGFVLEEVMVLTKEELRREIENAIADVLVRLN